MHPLSYAEGPRSGQSAVGRDHKNGEEGGISSLALQPTLFWVQPRTRLAFWAANSHCWLMSSFSSVSALKPSAGAALNPFPIQPVLTQEMAPTQVQDLSLALLSLRSSHRPTSQTCPGPLGQHPVPPSMSTAPLSLMLSAHLLRVHSNPLSHS